MEEATDYLDEVEAPRPRLNRMDHVEDDRPRRRLRRRSRDAGGEYLWLIAVAAAVACFFISLGVTLADYGLNGLPADQGGNYPLKVGALAFGVLVALIFAGAGVLAVKTRTFYARGQVTTGPLAVVLGMIITITGGSLGGFVVYGLLLALIGGR